ncbi:hypothetical protein FHS27_001236 [Rhodopirellula rubra]|uniref:Uncharacterized protein n=1 Tax=Aporhodopirellula rubra TaxID=980271 RepID=A0A7W5DVU0_9BACT|nr:hypothetical protein [Aporhodopirellula rubra]MBB3205436.1 hypothetical protein [Aporhodopirellula rubra]
MPNANIRQRIEAEYIAAHARALTLLEDLHQRIEDTPAPTDDGPAIGWDDVGSLKHLCEQLQDLKNHFSPDDAGN